jgi:hypothetical protein
MDMDMDGDVLARAGKRLAGQPGHPALTGKGGVI